MAIKFEIYKDGTRLSAFHVAGATAVGTEGVPVAGDVRFKDGLVVVDRGEETGAVGVALLWEIWNLGSFILETTRLPQREEPYILNVELARCRLMKIVQKQEDWNLFDFPKAERFGQLFKESQQLLADALGALDTPAEAARLADLSLAISVDLSEQLALFHSDLLVNRRRTAQQFVKHTFGVRIDPLIQNSRYRDLALSAFDYVVVPMSWRAMQPAEQQFNTEPVDQWVNAVSAKRMPIVAGPLIRLSESDVPDWMTIWEHDYDTMRDMAYEYVQRMVTRYRKGIAVWNVVSGLSAGKMFHLNFEQIIDLTRLLIAQVKNLQPNAVTLVSISSAFGDDHTREERAVAPMAYAEMVNQSGISFEGYGLELELGVPAPGMFMRDLFQVSSMLDKFATLGKRVFLTATCVPGRHTVDRADRSEGKLDPSRAGYWRHPWDPHFQAEWMESVYRVALSKPFVESVVWSNLIDTNATVPGGGLLDDMLQPKPAFNKIAELRERFGVKKA